MVIRELTIPTERPRCAGPIMDPASQEYRRFHKRDLRCARQSSVEINGQSYCGQHAGVVVLNILLSRRGEWVSAKKEDGVSIRIVTVKLKGPWAPGDKDWDRGIVQVQTASSIALADNEHQLNVRSYPMGNVARIEETGHW